MDSRRPKKIKRKSPSSTRPGAQVDYSVLEPRMLLAADINPTNSIDGLWEPLTSETVSQPGDRIHVQATNVELFDLQEDQLLPLLAKAPMEFTAAASQKPTYQSVYLNNYL